MQWRGGVGVVGPARLGQHGPVLLRVRCRGVGQTEQVAGDPAQQAGCHPAVGVSGGGAVRARVPAKRVQRREVAQQRTVLGGALDAGAEGAAQRPDQLEGAVAGPGVRGLRAVVQSRVPRQVVQGVTRRLGGEGRPGARRAVRVQIEDRPYLPLAVHGRTGLGGGGVDHAAGQIGHVLGDGQPAVLRRPAGGARVQHDRPVLGSEVPAFQIPGQFPARDLHGGPVRKGEGDPGRRAVSGEEGGPALPPRQGVRRTHEDGTVAAMVGVGAAREHGGHALFAPGPVPRCVGGLAHLPSVAPRERDPAQRGVGHGAVVEGADGGRTDGGAGAGECAG